MLVLSSFGVASRGLFSDPFGRASREPPTVGFRLLATYPHDSGAFTQGLYYEHPRGTLLESTGLYGSSTVRRVDFQTGRVRSSESLPDDWFGEGLTAQGDRCVQLLWKNGHGLVRDRETLKLRGTFPLPRSVREGWGLTHDGEGTFFVSDGTSQITCLDTSFAPARTLTVRSGGRELRQLNELQWVRGELWANIWHDDRVAVINPTTGEVRCFIDLSDLLSPQERRQLHEEFVLNGLAFDEHAGRVFVTGKCWPWLFEIAVELPESS